MHSSRFTRHAEKKARKAKLSSAISKSINNQLPKMKPTTI
jgi:hypothetical protein